MSDVGSDSARLRFEFGQIGFMEEIMMNILSKLPVKTVMACKCVAKHWLKLISEPSFPLLQLTWSSTNNKMKYIICPYPQDHDIFNHLCLMEENGRISEEIYLPGFESICSPEMTCFSNGLICSVNEDFFGLNEVDIRIFNAVTQDTILLPRGSPSLVIPTVGIAFDPRSHNFKAFRFFSCSVDEDDVKYECEVYTSESPVWRKISEEVERPEHSPFHPVCPFYVSIAGVVYWFAWSEDKLGVPSHIVSVDMKDKFSEIELPAELDEWSFLIELEGCLSVVHIVNPEVYEECEQNLEVYKLEKGSWSLRSKGVLVLMNVDSFNSVACRDKEIFFIVKHEDEDENEYFSYIVFDIIEKSLKMLNLEERFEDYCPVAFPFYESLLKCSAT